MTTKSIQAVRLTDDLADAIAAHAARADTNASLLIRAIIRRALGKTEDADRDLLRRAGLTRPNRS